MAKRLTKKQKRVIDTFAILATIYTVVTYADKFAEAVNAITNMAIKEKREHEDYLASS